MTSFDQVYRRSRTGPAASGVLLLLILPGAALIAPSAAAPATGARISKLPPGMKAARIATAHTRATQTGAPVPATSPATAAPAAPIPGTPAPVPSRPITLDQVLDIALRNNSSITLARQRLSKAEEEIAQVDAQARPQVNASLTDTLSSQRGFNTTGGAVTNPSLPGGGQIPTVTDVGGGNNSGFVGGGGGGTSSSTGSIGVSGVTTTGAGSGGLGTGGLGTGIGTTGTGTTGTGGTGFGSGTGGLGTSGAGISGTGTAGTGSGGVGTTGSGIGGTGTAGTGTTGTGNTGTGNTGTGGTTNGTGATGTFGTTGPTAPGAGTTGTGTGAGGAGAMAVPQSGNRPAVAVVADLPPIMRQYAAATRAGARTTPLPQAAGRLQPRDTTGPGTGAGTGDGTGGTTATNFGSGGQFNNYGGRVTVSQYIDIFGLLGTARDVEKITRDFYAIDLQRIANETALSAKNLYFNVLKAQGQVGVDQEQVNFAADNVRITQARAAAGLSAQFDVLSAQTQLSNAQQQLISAQNSLSLNLQNLNNLLGLRLDQTLALQTPPLPPLTLRFDTTQTIRTAFGNRPELKQATNNLVIAQRLIRLAGEGLKPTLGLVANASYSGATSGGTRRDTYNLSAQLGIPLSDGGLTRSRVRSAQIDLQTQRITQATLLQSVELEVRQALININDAQAQASSATQGVTQAQEAVRLAQVRYQNGLGTLLDVTNAQANLATARFNLLNAQFAYQTAIAQLVRAQGGR